MRDEADAFPTGNVTFLFTDIEGSTRLWDTQHDEMSVALAQHDALLRSIIAQHGGYVFKTIGDAFCAAFTSAAQAVAASVAIQRELRTADATRVPLRVRAALHTGTAHERAGDYFGPTVNRTARLMIGAGGQTLMSLTTQSLVAEILPVGVSLLDLGLHRLKDLQHPEHIFQLCDPEFPAEFPPLNSLETRAHNLPEQLTSFIGREEQLAAVHERLQTARLLTLTGPGGGGKTRLALQAAVDQIDRFHDGVWLVEFAALTDPGLVVQETASVFGIREQAGQNLQEALQEFLKPRTLLLVLDNCEHLTESCARLTSSLLRSCPNLRILATSRAPLGVRGESIQAVPPLDLPNSEMLPAQESEIMAVLNRSEATNLFIDRAVTVSPSFVVNAENAKAVIDICRRLDGIPLAIELAAARITVLSAEQIATRLQDRFRLLVDKNRRTDLPRQQTLRATLDWSYDLLTEREQVLLRRLSIFAGGWTLDTAEAICAGDDMDEFDVLDLLAQLVDKSLVFTQEQRGASRYRLLETVREYASEKLEVSGETHAMAQRHAVWFAQWAVLADANLAGEAQAQWLEKFENDHDNLRTSLAWHAANPEHADENLRMTAALWRFWTIRGYLKEGRDWLTAALAQAEHAGLGTSPERAKALTAAGSMAWSQGDYRGAHILLEENLRMRRALSDAQGVADALNNLGNVAADEGDYAIAQALFEESLASMRLLVDAEGTAAVLNNLARTLYRQGEYQESQALYEESLREDRRRGDEWGMANSLCGLAQLDAARGDFDSARACLSESLRLRQEVADLEGLAECLEVFAEIAATQNQLAQAVCMRIRAQRTREILGVPLPPLLRAQHDKGMETARKSLTTEEFENACTQGTNLSIEQAAIVCVQYIQ